jgi:tape measure domain-containing protein
MILDTSQYEQALRSIVGMTSSSAKKNEKAFKDTSDSVDETTDKLKNQKKEVNGLANAFQALGGIIGSAAIIGGMKSVVMEAAKFETVKTSFEVLTGSVSTATKLLKELDNISLTTPFTPQQIQGAGKTLLAFGFNVSEVGDTIKMLGDVSAGTGKDLSEMAVIFGQIKGAGQLMGQDLMQLINAGFNPLQVMSQKTGKSMAELKKEMSAGKITYEQVAQAFKDATSEGGMFNNMMEKQSQTLEGLLSTADGSFAELKKLIGEEFTPIIKSLTSALIGVINSIINFKKENPALFKTIVQLTAGMAGLLAVIIGGSGLIASVKMVIPVIKTLGLTFQMSLGPIGLVAAAVTGLAGAYLLLRNRAEEARKAQARSIAEQSVNNQNIDQQLKRFNQLVKASDNVQTVSAKQRESIINDLVSAGLKLEQAQSFFHAGDTIRENGKWVQSYNLRKDAIKAYREELLRLKESEKQVQEVSPVAPSGGVGGLRRGPETEPMVMVGSYNAKLAELEARYQTLTQERDNYVVHGSDAWNDYTEEIEQTEFQLKKLKEEMQANAGMFEPLTKAFEDFGLKASKILKAILGGTSELINGYSNMLNTMAQAEQQKFQNTQQQIGTVMEYGTAIVDRELQNRLKLFEAEIDALQSQKDELIRIEREYQMRRDEMRNEEIAKIRAKIEEEYQLEAERLQREYELDLKNQDQNMASEEQRRFNQQRLQEEHLQTLNDLRKRYNEMTEQEIRQLTETMSEEDRVRSESHKTELEAMAENEKRIQAEMNKAKEDADKEKMQLEKKMRRFEWVQGKDAFEAGKQAQMASIQIQMAQGLMSAAVAGALLAATVPVIGWVLGPALGIALAAMVASAGMASLSAVGASQYPPPPATAFAQGGLVTGGMPNKDSVPAMLMPGELVVPKQNFEEVVGSVSDNRSGMKTVNITGNNFYGIENPMDFVEQVKEILLEDSRMAVGAFA